MVQDVGELNWKLKTGFFSKIISTASKTGLTNKEIHKHQGKFYEVMISLV